MYKKTCSILLTVFISISILGCASPLSVSKLQDFSPSSKTLVLLESSRFDTEIRKSLSKYGFKALKFPSVNKVISEGNQGEIARIYNQSEARYGLTFHWEQIDRCLVNSSKKIDGTFEISDLSTNEVILIIEQGGWTGDCAYHKGTLFNDLTKALLENWQN